MPIDLLVLALLSAFRPTLVVVDVLAFETKSPERILLAFLAGGLLTTVTIGTLIVVAFDNSQFGSSSQTAARLLSGHARRSREGGGDTTLQVGTNRQSGMESAAVDPSLSRTPDATVTRQ